MIKVNKSQALLFIFHVLLEKKKITKEEIMSRIDIEDLTFRRYMQEIRAYLSNFYINKDLVYSRKDEAYYLIDILY